MPSHHLLQLRGVPTPNNDTDHADDYDFNNRVKSQPPTTRQKRLSHDNRNNNDHPRPTTSSNAQRQQDFHSTQLPTPTYVPTPNNNFDLPPSWENANNADDYDDSNGRTKRRRHKPATYNDHDQFSPLGLAMPAVHPPASPPDLSRLATNPTPIDVPTPNSDSDHADDHDRNSPANSQPPTKRQKRRPRLTNQRIPASQRHPTLPDATCPFLLDFHGAWWNTQALFASDPILQHNKHSRSWNILDKVDFMGMAETHSTEGHIKASSLPQKTTFFWSHGRSRHQAGVALAVKTQFLKNFNPVKEKDWEEIEPGRMARLSLRGPKGGLDLYAIYFPTGTLAEEQTLKKVLTLRLQKEMRPQLKVLSILMGDFNFVMKNEDRLCLRTMEHTGRHDKPTADRFNQLLEEHKLHELEQPIYTHTNTTAHSRIDRIYSNHHVADQLDRTFAISALARTNLSTHRPITFSRKTKPKNNANDNQGPFPAYILHHENWKRDLHLNYHERLHDSQEGSNPLRRLELLKMFMWEVANKLKQLPPPKATSTEDKLSWTMVFIRAAENLAIGRMEKAATAYPHLASILPAGDPNNRIKEGFITIKNHAVELAQQLITDELVQLHNGDEEPNGDPSRRRKQQLTTKMSRLMPGATNSIGAISTGPDEELASTPQDIAKALKKHWEPIFQDKPICATLLKDWLNTTPSFLDHYNGRQDSRPQQPLRRRRSPRRHQPQYPTRQQRPQHQPQQQATTTANYDDQLIHSLDYNQRRQPTPPSNSNDHDKQHRKRPRRATATTYSGHDHDHDNQLRRATANFENENYDNNNNDHDNDSHHNDSVYDIEHDSHTDENDGPPELIDESENDSDTNFAPGGPSVACSTEESQNPRAEEADQSRPRGRPFANNIRQQSRPHRPSRRQPQHAATTANYDNHQAQALDSKQLRQTTSTIDNHDLDNHDLGNGAPRTQHLRPPLTTDAASWQVEDSDIAKAVKRAGNSSPGPDGIPYAAWKHSGDLAITTLHDAATALQSDDAPHLLDTMHGNDIQPDGHAFNLGLLICLGKKHIITT